MLSDEFPEYGIGGATAIGGTLVTIHLHVDNADEVIRIAVNAGAIRSAQPIVRSHSKAALAGELEPDPGIEAELEDKEVKDDHLRLIFICCHPALSLDAQVALTLREVCGLTTEEIARAFLITPPTVAQRIVRAKAKIRAACIFYEIPTSADLPSRLDSVLRVLYLVFNEGYTASSRRSLTRPDLSSEAIRLGRLLIELLPEPEAMGLLGLMLLQESRRMARTSPTGDLVLLEEQDRSRWNREQIAEGLVLVESALSSRRFGPYTLQAAIAVVHPEARAAYQRALALARQEPERRFLERRLTELNS